MATGNTNSIGASSISAEIMNEVFNITPTVVDSSSEEEFQYDNYNAPYVDSLGEEYEGVKNIQVRKIGSWIDSEISADNIREGHSILGVAGNVIQLDAQPNVTVKPSDKEQIITPNAEYNSLSQVTVQAVALEEKTVTPTTSNQTISPSGDNVGLSRVIVNGVTSAIDEDIKPENIKKDVDILGVIGTYEPSYTKKDLVIEPSIEEQTITPQSQEVDAFENITVNPVTSAIDANITAKNIKKGITILGVEGNYVLENLQDKVVNPTMEKQVVTFDSDQYQGLNTVTVNAVTASIDDDIKPENIKSGINILGIDGSYSGDMNIENNVSAEPKTTPVIVTPSDGYDAMSKVTINAVTSAIDTNILAENIKKGISILGVEGTLESTSSNIQSEKTVEPSVADITVNPDEGYDALLKVIVKAVTASIDPNILSKNIKYGVNILGVVGELVEGKPQQWFDFEDMKQITQITTNTMGAGGDDSLDVKLNENDYTVEASVITEDFKAISNISAILFNVVLGYDDETVEYPIISQPFIYFTDGYYYSSYTDFHLVPNRLSYIYNYNNEIGVDGCLLNYTDTGDEKTLKLYVMMGEKETRPILVDGDLSSEMLPDGYSSFKYVRDITITEHTLFEPKYTENGELNWVLKDRKGVSYITNEETDNYPANISVSAFDKNYGEEDNLIEESNAISSNDFEIVGTLNIDNKTAIASNFSNTNYIKYNNLIKYSEALNWSIEFKVKINELDHYQYWYNKHFHWGLNSSNKMVIYNMKSTTGSTIISSTTGNTVFEKDQWYYVKLEYDSSSNKYRAYSKKNLEDEWTTEFEKTSSYKLNDSSQIDIGSNIDNSSEYMYGEIDLSETIITLDNVIVWRPYTKKSIKITSHDIIPLTNNILLTPYTKHVGSKDITTDNQYTNSLLTYNDEQNTISGGKANSQLQFNNFDTNNKSFEFNLHIKTLERLEGTILDFNASYGMLLSLLSTGFRWALSSNNGNWNILDENLNCEILPNTDYYINISYNKEVYVLKVATDKNFTNIVTSKNISSTSNIYNSAKQFVLMNRYKYQITANYFDGILYLDDTYVKIDNEYYFAHEFKEYKEIINGNLLNYIDDGSSKQLKLFEISNASRDYIEKVEYIQPILNNDGTLGGDFAACQSSVYENENSRAYKAFDGNMLTKWQSGSSSTPQNIIFYDPNKFIPTEVDINFVNGEVYASGEIFGSLTNNDDWVSLATFENNELDTLSISFINDVEYNYIKIQFNSLYSGWGQIYEIKIKGTANRLIKRIYNYVLSDNEIPTEKLPEGYNTSLFIDNVQIPTHSTNWTYNIETNTWSKV